MRLPGARNNHYYRDVVSQGVYQVLFNGIDTRNRCEVIVYKACRDPTVLVRPKIEFCDGRFEYIGDILDLKAEKYGV